ncbi:MAG: hypothetical protein R2911_41100, partial [Caldilineaceae bacterium]
MRRNWIFLNLLLAAVLLLSACTAAAPAQPSQAGEAAAPAADSGAAAAEGTGGTLIVGRGGDSVLLDNGAVTDGESARVINTITEGLVALEGTST